MLLILLRVSTTPQNESATDGEDDDGGFSLATESDRDRDRMSVTIVMIGSIITIAKYLRLFELDRIGSGNDNDGRFYHYNREIVRGSKSISLFVRGGYDGTKGKGRSLL